MFKFLRIALLLLILATVADDARTFFLHQYKAQFTALKTIPPILIVDTDYNVAVKDSHSRVAFDWDGDFFETKRLARQKHP